MHVFSAKSTVLIGRARTESWLRPKMFSSNVTSADSEFFAGCASGLHHTATFELILLYLTFNVHNLADMMGYDSRSSKQDFITQHEGKYIICTPTSHAHTNTWPEPPIFSVFVYIHSVWPEPVLTQCDTNPGDRWARQCSVVSTHIPTVWLIRHICTFSPNNGKGRMDRHAYSAGTVGFKLYTRRSS